MTSTSVDPQMNVRRMAVLLGALFLLPAAVALPAQTAPSAKLIYAGWFGYTTPTPAFVAANKSFLETQPFQGLIIYLRNDATGVNATTRTMTTTPISAADLSTMLAPMRNTTFSVLRENLALIRGVTPPDFFDDWTVPIANFAAVARAVKDAGLRGVVIDNEQYASPWGNYPDGVKYTWRSLAEYQVQARLRGKQVMQAMAAQFPEIQVLTLHGPTVSEPKVPEPLFPLWYMANELLGPFFSGFMEGDNGAAVNIDGGELYHLRSADEFLRSYNWRKYTLPSDPINCAFIPPAMRPAWPGMSSISFGVYDKPFRGAAMDSTIARTTIANALRQADRYVWFYTEGPTFLRPASQGGASSTWVNAVRGALADAGSGTVTTSSPSSGPAAPSNFVATATSSSAIDLSWWDMSNNETGFEIERKIGSTGTWARVLTTGANVSTMDDIGLTPSTNYYYRARAVNSSGPSAYSNESSATTSSSAGAGPAAPINLTLRTRVVGRIGVTWWDMSNNETGFQVERKTGSTGTWALLATKGANVSIHDDYTVVSGRVYFYRVRAVNGSSVSAWTNELSVSAP